MGFRHEPASLFHGIEAAGEKEKIFLGYVLHLDKDFTEDSPVLLGKVVCLTCQLLKKKYEVVRCLAFHSRLLSISNGLHENLCHQTAHLRALTVGKVDGEILEGVAPGFSNHEIPVAIRMVELF